MRHTRFLRTKDIEVWELKLTFKCYLILIDMKRPSTLEDYPYLIGIEDPDDFGRDNYIKVITLSTKEIEGNIMEKIVSLVDDLIGHAIDQGFCDWNIEERISNNKQINEDVYSVISEFALLSIDKTKANKNLNQD